MKSVHCLPGESNCRFLLNPFGGCDFCLTEMLTDFGFQHGQQEADPIQGLNVVTNVRVGSQVRQNCDNLEKIKYWNKDFFTEYIFSKV
jgi:hypothetical protein